MRRSDVLEYKAQLISLNKLIDADIIKEGTLCDGCKCFDCSNPIVYLTVSVLGVNKKMRVWKNGNNRSAVIGCEGFRKTSVNEEEVDDND